MCVGVASSVKDERLRLPSDLSGIVESLATCSGLTTLSPQVVVCSKTVTLPSFQSLRAKKNAQMCGGRFFPKPCVVLEQLHSQSLLNLFGPF